MERKRVNSRRNYLIKKGLQSGFIFGFTLKVVVGFLASWLFVYYLVDKKLSEALYRSHINIGSTGEIISDILLKVNLLAIPFIIIAAIIFGELMLKRKISPLKEFKGAMEDFGRGDLTAKDLKDNPVELSASYNAMVRTFSMVFMSINKEKDDLDKIVDKLKFEVDKKTISKQDVEDICVSISASRENIEKEIAFFKV